MILGNMQVAKLCHEVNRAYCEAIGDNSQPTWEKTSVELKVSAINGVLYTLAHPEVTPGQSHENWFHHKESTGWKYGPVKDIEKKEHPCMVPYDQLPTEQKIKDHIFTTIVKTLASMDK